MSQVLSFANGRHGDGQSEPYGEGKVIVKPGATLAPPPPDDEQHEVMDRSVQLRQSPACCVLPLSPIC